MQNIQTQSEQEYQKWLRAFYKGSFFVKGWDSIKRELHSKVGSQCDEIGQLLDELGDLIGREWAKDNHIRKIDTDDLKQWGDHLRHAGKKSADDVTAAIHTIKEQAFQRLAA
ncbi:hypothetical protein C942_04257 [Photobacterium marinum]|uniref:Uncharacterized protein n=1 Tax=Photobacterium marinum TaxID=1056511 RepID=L8JGB5_9GAMM|nr:MULTISPECIES: hypothetical protein [Photobacterium]ELR66559.1 hypothetical protein C942_04257 [Photobacterium marinum]